MAEVDRKISTTIQAVFRYRMGNIRFRFNPGKARMTDEKDAATMDTAAAPAKTPTPAAKRALAEAEARRRTYHEKEVELPKEFGGRGGKEPGRYGDWEIKGLTSDF